MKMTLKYYYKLYPTQQDCINHLEKIIWNGKPICPYCTTSYQTPLKNTNRYHCNNCNMSYSVSVRTMFHKTRIDLQKWFYLIFILLNTNKKLSTREIAKEINVTKDTAWRMLKMIKQDFIKQQTLLNNIIRNSNN